MCVVCVRTFYPVDIPNRLGYYLCMVKTFKLASGEAVVAKEIKGYNRDGSRYSISAPKLYMHHTLAVKASAKIPGSTVISNENRSVYFVVVPEGGQ